jgi:hypothetical protein
MPLHHRFETRGFFARLIENICSTTIAGFNDKPRRFLVESPAQRLSTIARRRSVKLYELLGANVSLPMSGIREP